MNRIFSIRSTLAILALVFVSASALAKDTGEVFEQLRNVGADYTNTGAICEQVSRLDFIRTYPESSYVVVTGVSYGDNSHTIGELDVVIARKTDHKVVLVGEVKCWKNMSKGLRKAREQRARFVKTLRGNRDFHFFGNSEVFKVEDFNNDFEMAAIAQKGSRSSGYDYELEYTLPELMDLREQLINCQKRNECAPPVQ